MLLDLHHSHINLHFLLGNSLWDVPMFFRIETTSVLSICIFSVKFEKSLAKHFRENIQLTILWHLCDNIFLQEPVNPCISILKIRPPTSVWCITIDVYSWWVFTYFIKHIREIFSPPSSWNSLYMLHNYVFMLHNFCSVPFNIKY